MDIRVRISMPDDQVALLGDVLISNVDGEIKAQLRDQVWLRTVLIEQRRRMPETYLDRFDRRADRLLTQLDPRQMVAETFDFGRLHIDIASRRTLVDGQTVALRGLQFQLLVALARRAGEAVSKRELLRDVWGPTADTKTRTVDSHVTRLRADLGLGRDLIVTIWGFGYRLDPARAL